MDYGEDSLIIDNAIDAALGLADGSGDTVSAAIQLGPGAYHEVNVHIKYFYAI